jgi:oligopeptide transport system substrate-binding protein
MLKESGIRPRRPIEPGDCHVFGSQYPRLCNTLSACACFIALVLITVTSCTNNPYRPSEKAKNFLYSTFAEPPKHLDPAVAYSSDEYEFILEIYDPPLQYHYLKRPYELVPLTAEEIPAPQYLDAEGKVLGGDPSSGKVQKAVYTVRIRKGILYQEHPCFAKDGDGRFLYHDLTEGRLGKIQDIDDFPETGSRELTAEDYVYQIKRLAHPKIECPLFSTMTKYILGLDELAQELQGELNRIRTERRKEKGTLYNQERDERENPIWLDLDAFPLEGARVVDRYTYEITLKRKYPQFVYWLAMPFFAPLPREADRFYEQAPLIARNLKLDNRPVGTGPYLLKTFLPNKEIVLARNENFHGETYPEEGEPEDRALGLLDDAGKQLPFIQKAIYKQEKEAIPRWNKFLQGYYDTSGIINEVFDQAVQTSSEGDIGLSDSMKEQDIRLLQTVSPLTYYFAFNMLDDVVGGYKPEKQKLRRAISIAVDMEEWIQIFDNGRGLPAQDILPPGIFGHRPGKEGVNEYVYEWDEEKGRPERRSIEQAKQLLAEAGYPGGKDREGNPLMVHFDTNWTGAWAKPRLDWIRKQFRKLDIDLQIRQTDYNRFREKVKKGNFQILFWGWSADYPDPENFLFLLYGPNGKARHGGENSANYANPAFDRLFRRMESMRNSPERLKIIDQMLEIAGRDAPMIWGYHPVAFGLYHDWYRNAKPMTIGGNSLKYTRIDPKLRERQREAWNRPILWPVIAFFAVLVLAALPAVVAAWSRQRRVGMP